jgi:hypothetical protein
MMADLGFSAPCVPGYFSPQEKVLYLYNLWGERWQKFYYDGVTSASQKIDDKAANAKNRYNTGSDEIVVDGFYQDLKNVYWDWYNIHKEIMVSITSTTLRHELTHEILNNWGLQNIVLSKADVDQDEVARKKKEMIDAIEADDKNKQEGIFREIVNMDRKSMQGYAAECDGSWITEGMATYCESYPFGSINEERLFEYQDAAAKNELNPIEFLTSFKMGSFIGLCEKAKLSSYGESWALVYFLMNRYRDKFLEFQEKMADAGSRKIDQKEQLKVLLESLGKDLPSLEKEFRDYMATLPKADDRYVRMFMRYNDIWQKFLTIH